MNYRYEKFLLDVFDDLNKLDEVKDIGNGKYLGKNQLERKIRLFLANKRLELLKAEQGIIDVDKLKETYYNKYCIKCNQIDRLVERKQKKLQLKLLDEEVRTYRETLNAKLNEQKRTLNVWIDNLLLNPHYPIWFKYWCFHKIVTIDENFKHRRNDSYAPFLRFNNKIVSKIYTMAENHFNGKESNLYIAKGMFAELYSMLLLKSEKNESLSLNFKNGKWIKYNKGTKEDAKRLYDSLHGKSTGWCTDDYGTVAAQLCGGRIYCGGDFYIYYTIDDNNEYTIPRIAIRMEEDKIAEIRGIGINQNVEPGLEEIVQNKINEFNMNYEDKRKYLIACNDSRKLTELIQKIRRKEKLSEEEMEFIFEVNRKIEYFGFGQDKRVTKIKKNITISDKNFMLKAVSKNGFVLEYASEELKKDKEVVFAAVKKNANALRYASEELKNDKEIVFAAVSQEGSVLEYVSDKLKNDKDFILKVISKNTHALFYISDKLKNDKDFMFEAVIQNAIILSYANEELKKDKDFIFKVACKNGSAFKYASEELKKDKDFILKILSQNEKVIKYVDDKDFMKLVHKKDKIAIKYISEKVLQMGQVALQKLGIPLRGLDNEQENKRMRI